MNQQHKYEMCRDFEEHIDHLDQMNVLRAFSWKIRFWFH